VLPDTSSDGMRREMQEDAAHLTFGDEVVTESKVRPPTKPLASRLWGLASACRVYYGTKLYRTDGDASGSSRVGGLAPRVHLAST
jgi:hypothetical protein